MNAERVRAFGALRRVWSKMKLAAKKQQEMYYLCNEEKEKWIEDYVERETTMGRKWVENAESAITKEQDDLRTAQNVGLTTREFKKIIQVIKVTSGESMSNLASSNNEEDAEDENDEDIFQGNLSNDDESGWVMGTFSKCTAAHGTVSAEADEACLIDTTTNGGHCWQLLWQR